uniref:non-specific serine/threonine protein kinase n=1 Tax=Latid herpesvirus 1 TaxID=3096545 RepID=A0AB33V994_9VIRU
MGTTERMSILLCPPLCFFSYCDDDDDDDDLNYFPSERREPGFSTQVRDLFNNAPGRDSGDGFGGGFDDFGFGDGFDDPPDKLPAGTADSFGDGFDDFEEGFGGGGGDDGLGFGGGGGGRPATKPVTAIRGDDLGFGDDFGFGGGLGLVAPGPVTPAKKRRPPPSRPDPSLVHEPPAHVPPYPPVQNPPKKRPSKPKQPPYPPAAIGFRDSVFNPATPPPPMQPPPMQPPPMQPPPARPPPWDRNIAQPTPPYAIGNPSLPPFASRRAFNFKDSSQTMATGDILSRVGRRVNNRPSMEEVQTPGAIKNIVMDVTPHATRAGNAVGGAGNQLGSGRGGLPFHVQGCQYIPSNFQKHPIAFSPLERMPFDSGTRLRSVTDQQRANPFRFDKGKELLLGKGCFGAVYKISGLACKIQDSDKTTAINPVSDILEESIIGSRLRHPSIARFYKAIVMGDGGVTRFRVVSFWELGAMDMYTFLSESFWTRGASAAVKRYISRRFERHVLEGLAHMHSVGIMHRDIKPTNIIIFKSGDNLVAKIGDLGTCCMGTLCDASGTDAYFAPETLALSLQAPASDIWAWGLTMWELQTGRRLFGDHKGIFAVLGGYPDPAMNNMLILKRNMAPKDKTPRLTIELEAHVAAMGVTIPVTFMAVLKSILKLNPGERPTADDLLRQPRYADASLMEGVSGASPPDVNPLTLPDSIAFSDDEELRSFKVLTSCSLATDDLRDREYWGAVAQHITGDLTPPILYFPHMPEKNAERMTYKTPVELSDKCLMMSNTVTAPRSGLKTVSIYKPPGLVRPDADMVIFTELHESWNLDVVRTVMDEIMKLSASVRGCIPVYHYSIGETGRVKYMAFVTDMRVPLATFDMGQLTISGANPRSLVLLKQLMTLSQEFLGAELVLNKAMYHPYFFFASRKGLDSGPVVFNLPVAALHIFRAELQGGKSLRDLLKKQAMRGWGQVEKALMKLTMDLVVGSLNNTEDLTQYIPERDIFCHASFKTLVEIPLLKAIHIPAPPVNKHKVGYHYIRINPPPALSFPQLYTAGPAIP